MSGTRTINIVRLLISYGIFPIVFITALIAVYFGMQKGINEGIMLGTVALGTSFITLVFERISPKHKSWNKIQNDLITDLIHALVSMILLPRVLDALFRVVLLVGAIAISDYIGFSLWPHHWPLILQLIIAMMISQFGEYWVHRSMHEIPFLWRFHSVHHSPKRLYWLNAARFHPIDTAASYTVAVAPLLLMGAPFEVITLFTVWATVHGLFQHCNIDVRLGFLNYIFSMAELHRWHHSLKLEEANSNYGNNIIFWDIVFGTLYYPKDRYADKNIGIENMPDFPEQYLQQIAIPFQSKKYWRNLE